MKEFRSGVLQTVWIALGTFCLAIALNSFLVPNKLSAGGISSVATILLYTTQIPLSITNLAANAILFFFGLRYVGKSSLYKTLTGILLLSLFLELTAGFPHYTENLVAASLSGGVFMGLGLGLVVRCGASTGGSDFAALIFHRFFPHISVVSFILLIDCFIILISGLVFRSVTITIFSILSLLVASKVADLISVLGYSAKKILIFSNRSDAIAQHILSQFQRGVTGIYAKGMFSSADQLFLMCIVLPKEVPFLIQSVRQIDPSAFLILSDVREVLGEGFRRRSSYDEIVRSSPKKTPK